MRVIFMGSPEYAINSLSGLLNSKHQVVAVITQPDAPKNRGHKLMPCPVKEFAQKKGIPVYDFIRVSRDGIDTIRELEPDIIITVAYGQILSSQLLSIPKYGVINAHASLLPKFRGASPIQSAIEAGEKTTGVTIMKTETGLDTGDILLIKTTTIGEEETAGELSDRLSKISSEAVLSALELIEKGKLMPKAQNGAEATICTKLTKSDSVINWNHKASQIKCKILSQNPSPVSRTMLGDLQLKIFRARVAKGMDNTTEKPGTIIAPTSAKSGVFVQCGQGVLQIVEACLPGGKIMDAKNLVMSNKIKVGMQFEPFAFGTKSTEE